MKRSHHNRPQCLRHEQMQLTRVKRFEGVIAFRFPFECFRAIRLFPQVLPFILSEWLDRIFVSSYGPLMLHTDVPVTDVVCAAKIRFQTGANLGRRKLIGVLGQRSNLRPQPRSSLQFGSAPPSRSWAGAGIKVSPSSSSSCVSFPSFQLSNSHRQAFNIPSLRHAVLRHPHRPRRSLRRLRRSEYSQTTEQRHHSFVIRC